jgi:hypothetical protein
MPKAITVPEPDEINILNSIYQVRNQKIMIDRDLAGWYGVETKRLKGTDWAYAMHLIALVSRV